MANAYTVGAFGPHGYPHLAGSALHIHRVAYQLYLPYPFFWTAKLAVVKPHRAFGVDILASESHLAESVIVKAKIGVIQYNR